MRKIKTNEELRHLRLSRGMSLQAASSAIGASLQSWFNWENGVVLPNLKYIKPIADVFGLEVNDVVKIFLGRD